MRSNGYKTEHKISVEETGKTYTRFNDNGKVTWCTMTKERFRIVGSKFRSELERTYQRNLTNLL